MTKLFCDICNKETIYKCETLQHVHQIGEIKIALNFRASRMYPSGDGEMPIDVCPECRTILIQKLLNVSACS